MGHTATSQRIVVDRIRSELTAYCKTLTPADREIAERLLKIPLQRVASISYTSSIHTWAIVLFSMILEQEKKYVALRRISASEQANTLDQRQD